MSPTNSSRKTITLTLNKLALFYCAVPGVACIWYVAVWMVDLSRVPAKQDRFEQRIEEVQQHQDATTSRQDEQQKQLDRMEWMIRRIAAVDGVNVLGDTSGDSLTMRSHHPDAPETSSAREGHRVPTGRADE